MKKRALPVAVLALAALAFTLGTCEFVIVGILPDIAAGLGTSLSAVGRLVSVFAIAYAVGTPFLTAAVSRFSHYRLLMALLGLFFAVNTASMLAPSAPILYATRVAAALITGTLTASAMLFAKEAVSHDQTARAIAAVYAGFSVAAVAGVPLGTAVCHRFGWRATFGALLVMTAVLAPVLAKELPHDTAAPGREAGLLHQFSILRDRRCYRCVLRVFFSAAATYTVYTYLTPILTEVLGLSTAAVSPFLLVMGLCSAVSNILSGRLGERGGIRGLPVSFAAQAALFAMMPLLLRSRPAGLAGLMLMGLLMYLLNTPVQVHALGLAETDYPFAANLCASVQPVSFNFGIALGSFVGSTVQEGWGLRLLGIPAAAFALLALWQDLSLLRAIDASKVR